KEVFFPLFLANGVTGVRDMGVSKEAFESLKQLRRQIAKGQLLGPRFVTPGPMLDGPRSFPPVEKIFLTTENEAREAVRWLKQNGSDFIKVHSFPSREVYFAIADEAKKQGLTLVGHLPVSVSLAEAIAAGQKSIEHNIGIPVACSTREAELRQQLLETIKEKRDDWPSVIRADAEATDTYNKQKAAALFSSLVQRGVWICPTLVTVQSNTMSNHDY